MNPALAALPPVCGVCGVNVPADKRFHVRKPNTAGCVEVRCPQHWRV